LRPNLVPRPRLIEKLNQGLQTGHKLTLISAPAGFGKTTLVTEWLYQKDEGGRLKDEETHDQIQPSTLNPHPSKAAWLSLDEGDNDLTRFLTYLIAALQTLALSGVEGAVGNIGEVALGMLQSSQPLPTGPVLTSLINDISVVPDRIILVLDDYHLIDPSPVDASTIDGALTFLIENSPPQMHLVIATREDPLLPLSRLRARGQLTEIRAADLRFTSSEAAEFLNQLMGLNLSAEDIVALERRTEGWVAGLQLAAISLQGKEDTKRRIESFSGSNRLVFDYLLEEVLNQQPKTVQTFLLQTSVLSRLTASLCDALTDQEDGQQTLEMLDRTNLFIVPLDEERRWYRYHHLFADLLRQRLRRIEPEQIPTLHGRASAWYEQNGQRSDAIRQALAAKDFERVAGLAELAWPEMDSSLQSAAWLGWVKALPDDLVRARPVLCAEYAWALLDGGEPEAAETRLRAAERWLDITEEMSERSGTLPAEMVVVDEEHFRFLPATIATARASHAQALGDLPGSLMYARRALELTPEEDSLRRAQATALLGITYWASGDLEAARKAMADWIDSMQKAGNIVFAVASTFALADIMVAQGRLREALRTYKQSLQLASGQDEQVQQISAHLYLGLAMLYHEIGDQEAAGQHLQESKKLGEVTPLIDWPYRWRLAQARLKEAEGDLEAALDQFDEAKHLYIRVSLPDIRPLEALKARVYVKQGKLTKALAWARERDLSVDDDLSYLREFEHITLARALIAEYKRDQAESSILGAMGLLDRLLQAADEGGRLGSVIEILIVFALAHQARNNIPLALAPLERALTLAEPEGYVRIFVDEGPPMAKLLTMLKVEGGRMRGEGARPILSEIEGPALSEGEGMNEYVHKLLAAFGKRKPHPSSFIPQPLIEPLSERELEVLQLIAEGLTNPQIASRLFLSLNTVKVHTRAIYGKLDVHNRTQAAARARALGILPAT
jgi:LuxR family maltose regulon positive regulatory protein